MSPHPYYDRHNSHHASEVSASWQPPVFIVSGNERNGIFGFHFMNQGLLFQDAFCIFIFRKDVRIVIEYGNFKIKTARIAKECDYDYFTTTLSISPLKNADKLNQIGNAIASEYGL